MFKINQKRGVKLNNFWTLFWKQGKIYKNLAPQNMVEVKEYNRKMLSILLFIGGLIMIVPIIATPFSVTKKSILTAYIFTVIFLYIVSLLQIALKLLVSMRWVLVAEGFSSKLSIAADGR